MQMLELLKRDVSESIFVLCFSQINIKESIWWVKLTVLANRKNWEQWECHKCIDSWRLWLGWPYWHAACSL